MCPTTGRVGEQVCLVLFATQWRDQQPGKLVFVGNPFTHAGRDSALRRLQTYVVGRVFLTECTLNGPMNEIISDTSRVTRPLFMVLVSTGTPSFPITSSN
jgi:hypothetical protein